MADEKLTALTANVAPISTDILYIVDDPGGTPLSQKFDFGASFQALWGLTPAADRLPYYTGAAAGALATFTAFGRSLVDDVDAAAGRGTLLLGTLATQSGTFTGSGTLATGGFTLTVPATGTAALLATANTFTVGQNISISSSANAVSSSTSGSGAAIRANAAGAGTGGQFWTNTGLALEAAVFASASTSAVHQAIKYYARASGTPGAGFGMSVLWQLESNTTNDVDVGRTVVLWNVATHASRVPDGVFYLTDSSAEREIWRGRANGTAAAIGFLGATPVARAAHIADPTGGAIVDGECRTAIAAINVVLENLGFNATS